MPPPPGAAAALPRAPPPRHLSTQTIMANVNVSPAAAKLAERHGIDLSVLEGSGSGGTITKADVERAIRASEGGPAPEDEATPVGEALAYRIAPGRSLQVVTEEEREGRRHVTARDVVRPGEEAEKRLLERLTSAQVRRLVASGLLVPATVAGAPGAEA